MTRRNPGANSSLRSIAIGIGSFSTTILLIIGSQAQGLAIFA